MVEAGARRVALAVLAASVFLLGTAAIGCTAGGPTRGGVVVVALTAEPTGFNPRTPQGNTLATNTVMSRVWPAAWTTGPDLQPVLNRALLQSAELDPSDPRTIVYRFNPDARWSDGDPIDADDFIHTWEVQRPGATDVDGSAVTAVGLESRIERLTAADGGRTVTAVLREPDPDWRALFSSPLVPAHVARRVGWNKGFDRFDPAVVVSGGPFRIESYQEGEKLTLVRNEAYWGEAALVDSIVLLFLGSADAAVPALRNGEVDVITAGGQIDVFRSLSGQGGVVVAAGAALASEFVAFNLRQPLVAVREVRQAFALALDRPTVVERTVGQLDPGAAVLNSRLFLPSQPGYRDTSGGRYDRPDLAAARLRLEGAGFAAGADGIYARGGERLSLRLVTSAGDALRQAGAELIQSQARAAGIEIRIVPTAELGRVLGSGDFDLALISQGSTLATSLTRVVFGTGGSANIAGYSNPQVDDLYVQAATQLDPTLRVELFNRIDGILWEDLPRLPLYQPRSIVAHSTRVRNVVLNPAGQILWNAERWEVRD